MKIKFITTSEARDILHEQMSKKGKEMEHIDQIENKEYEYSSAFSRHSTGVKGKQITESVMKISNIEEEIAVKISDLMPSNLEQLRSILISYKINLPEDILNKLLDYLNPK